MPKAIFPANNREKYFGAENCQNGKGYPLPFFQFLAQNDMTEMKLQRVLETCRTTWICNF